MSNKYFVKEQYTCSDRNKLDTDIRHYCKGTLDARVMTESQLKDAWKALQQCAITRNEKYARVSKKVNPHKLDLSNGGKQSTLLIISDVLHYIAYKVRHDESKVPDYINLIDWMWENAMQSEDKGYWITESTEPGVIQEAISTHNLVVKYQIEKPWTQEKI